MAVAHVRRLLLEHKFLLARNKLVQIGFALLTGLRYIKFAWWRKDPYAAFAATLGYERLATSVAGWVPTEWIVGVNAKTIVKLKEARGCAKLVDSYISSEDAIGHRNQFRSFGWEHEVRLRFPKSDQDETRQGDLMILKPCLGPREKGVLLIQYAEAFGRFLSIFDLERIAQSYRIVLEPSSWGYREPSILAFVEARTDVIVQAQDANDFEYIESLGCNLIPIRIGAGDWIDPERFQSGASDEKQFDLVMIASWLRLKRHEVLFRAISRCEGRIQRVALIGYPYGGRTKADIRREAEKWGVAPFLEFFENISREKVSEIVRRSRVGVMLTLREGANKGIYECLCCDVPIVISRANLGVNKDHINDRTGLMADDNELDSAILGVLQNRSRYSPRQWAIENTGYKNATLQLNRCLQALAAKNGEVWTQDIFAKKNDTNGRYVLEQDRLAADIEVGLLREFLRR